MFMKEVHLWPGASLSPSLMNTHTCTNTPPPPPAHPYTNTHTPKCLNYLRMKILFLFLIITAPVIKLSGNILHSFVHIFIHVDNFSTT